MDQAEVCHAPGEGLECCKNVLKYLMGHSLAFPFSQPVDPIMLGIPDYFHIIKQPMDLSTIQYKLDSKKYKDVSEFSSDVELVFKNACTYNPPTSDIYKMATTLKEAFTTQMKSVKKEGLLLHHVWEPEESVPWTREQKMSLCTDISSLSPDKLLGVVQILAANATIETEIEIDLDYLSTHSLMALKEYVDRVNLTEKSTQLLEKLEGLQVEVEKSKVRDNRKRNLD